MNTKSREFRLKTFILSKNLFFLLSFLSVFSLKAQFSESFFERMSSGDSKIGHYFGTEIQNGALAVRFADTLNTEVQWAKLDLQGNFQTFSAHLPNDYISPNERIIEVYESGINQFIVTQDSASNNQEGIRIYKYDNYTQSAGVFEFPLQLRNAYFQSYFMYGKIYVFYVESGVGMKRLKINPLNLALEENLFLGTFDYEIQTNAYRHYKLTHVLFQDENNMQVFASSFQNLVRINIVNNVPSPVETKNIGLTKVFGVNHSNNQIICLDNSNTCKVKKYALEGLQTLNEIVLQDSLDLPSIAASIYIWKYANNNNGKEVFIATGNNGKACYFENNTLISQRDDFSINAISHIEFLNDKPIIYGNKNLNYAFQSFYPICISYGDLPDLFYFKEYNGIYDFGDYNVKFGVGLNVFQPVENSAVGNFIFNRMIFSSGLNIRGKENGIYYGEDGIFESGSYKVGPYTNVNDYNHDIIHQFNESFYVDQEMLNYHVYAIENNLPNYVIPRGIMNWPAHGDVNKGQAYNLAPFVDLNQDGIYQAVEGEYPTFPGTRCLLNISHQHVDDFAPWGTGLEIHSYAYNFDCNDTIKDVVFYKTEIYNRSSRNYDSLAVGVHNDFDLGGFTDDYVGTNVENGLVYAYNADNFDEGQAGMQGFDDSLPTIASMYLKGVKFLSNNLDDLEGISSNQTVNGFGFDDGILDNEFKGLEYSFRFTGGTTSNMADPASMEEHFNYLNGKWRFGDTLFFGGNGFPGSSGSTTIPAKYIYPGESDPLHYGTNGLDPGFAWDEQQNGNMSGDRRILGSFGSTPLNAGDKLEYHFALLAGKRVPGWGVSQIDLFAKAAHAKNAFNSNLTSCGQTFDNLTEDQITFVSQKMKSSFIKLYPNPTHGELNIRIPQNTGEFLIEISDINGKVFVQTSLNKEVNTLDVTELQNGLYFVKISGKDFVETQKFIKN